MSWFGKLWRRWRGWWTGGPLIRAERVDDVPEDSAADVVYLVGDGPQPWSAAMRCPCRCGELIQLSLIPEDKPRWRASVEDNGAVTLHPSVWRVRGCKSHFFVRRGKIVWAKAGTGRQ